MRNIDYNNFVRKEHLNKQKKKFFTKIFKKSLDDINFRLTHESEDTLQVLSKNFKFNFNQQDLKKFKKFKSIVIIGMGGSILGAEAIYQFLNKKIKKNVYFINDIDDKKILNIKKKLLINKTLFIIISKSGNTIETLSNLFYLKIIKKNAKNVIVISEKNNNNILYSISLQFNLFHVEHKSHISGRFSVLSEVGLVPAYLMGVNILQLRKNVSKFFQNNEKLLLMNGSIDLTILHADRKINNLIFLNYVPEMEKFLFWCQQLIAESLGKKGKGFLPVISNMPKDHHSLLQLYLDGPKDKLFHIFSINDSKKEKFKIKKIKNKINYLDNKSLTEIKQGQKNALIETFIKNKIPFREFKIKKINEETLGELFVYFMLEIAIIGKLTKVNPFNQPAVEQVKVYTKKILT